MAGKVRFYRGAQGASLPATRQDGAIFIVERTGTDELGYNLGDMYVDMDNGKRLHIIPDDELITYKSSMSGTTSTLGQVYVFQELNKNGIAVGDGKAYIGDLPVYDFTVAETIASHTTSIAAHDTAITNHTNKLAAHETALVSKINAYLGTEYTDNSKVTQEQRNTDGLNDPNKDFPSSQNELGETLVLSRELWLSF